MTCTCDDHGLPLTFESMLSDPLIHMVMASDGVSMPELIAVLEVAREAVVAREAIAAHHSCRRNHATSVGANIDEARVSCR